MCLFPDAFKVDISLKRSKLKLSLYLLLYTKTNFAFVFPGIKRILKYQSSNVYSLSAFLNINIFFLHTLPMLCETKMLLKTGKHFLLFIASLPPCVTSSQLFVSPTSQSQSPHLDNVISPHFNRNVFCLFRRNPAAKVSVLPPQL